MRKFGIALFILLAVVALGAVFAPWKEWTAQALKRTLEKQGISGVDFTVDALAFDGIVLKNISFAELFTLNEMKVSYSARELLEGQIKELKADDILLKFQDKEIHARNAALAFTRQASGNWKGQWSVESVEVSNLPYPLPALKGTGDFTADTTMADITGSFKSEDASHHVRFSAHYDMKDVGKTLVTVEQAGLPWNGGMISTQNAKLRISGNERFKGVLKLEKIPLDMLLRSLTGDRASATGAVSGNVPLMVDDKGNMVIQGGNLAAPEQGKIILMPDAIPGNNQQLDILRSVLSNFQYKTLVMNIDGDKQEKLSAKLTVEGSNPDVYEGRPVKLNVQLTGDVLSLLQQSVPTLTDPKQLLKQGNYETP